MNLKYLFIPVIGILSLVSTVSAATEYTFPDKGDVAVKIQPLDSATGSYVVTVGLRTQEGQSISQVEGGITVDPEVWDLDAFSKDLENSFVKGDLFTNSSSDIKPDNLAKGVIEFKGNTDVGYSSSTPVDAFSIILKLKSTNKSDTTKVTIKSDSFRLVDLKKDPQLNLFQGEVSDSVSGLPVSAETVVTPVEVTPVEVVDSGSVVPDKVTVTEVAPVVDTTKDVKTGAKANVLMILSILAASVVLLYSVKAKKA